MVIEVRIVVIFWMEEGMILTGKRHEGAFWVLKMFYRLPLVGGYMDLR